MGVGVAGAVVVEWEVTVDVHMAFEACESFMESVCFHAVLDA